MAFDSVVDSSALVLTDDRGRVVDGVLSCASPCTTLIFTPSRTLHGRTTYGAELMASGGGGTTNHTWTFTTGRRNGKPG